MEHEAIKGVDTVEAKYDSNTGNVRCVEVNDDSTIGSVRGAEVKDDSNRGSVRVKGRFKDRESTSV